MPAVHDPFVVIIGAGPAGITAGIQLKRCQVPFVLYEKERVGGLLWNANHIENYPGFPDGISGPDLVCLLERQMTRLGVVVTHEEVETLDFDNSDFLVIANKNSYQPRWVVVATGTRPIPCSLPVPATLQEKVFRDVAPLLGEKEKHIVIIGAGDAAFDHALNLVKNRNSVTILGRGQDVKCLALLFERVTSDSRITYLPGVNIIGIKEGDMTDSLMLEFDANGQSEHMQADYLIFAAGRDPRLDFISKNVSARRQELENTGRLYLAGDVCNGRMRQMAIAAGDGLRVAMKIDAAYHGREQ